MVVAGLVGGALGWGLLSLLERLDCARWHDLDRVGGRRVAGVVEPAAGRGHRPFHDGGARAACTSQLAPSLIPGSDSPLIAAAVG